MTREQRLKFLKQIEKDIHVCSLESTLLDDAKSCAIHSVIEELEQEPILNKIRAEIKEQYGGCGLINDGLDIALSIIDKYMEESEGRND